MKENENKYNMEYRGNKYVFTTITNSKVKSANRVHAKKYDSVPCSASRTNHLFCHPLTRFVNLLSWPSILLLKEQKNNLLKICWFEIE